MIGRERYGFKSVMARAFKRGFGIYDDLCRSQESEIRQRTNDGNGSGNGEERSGRMLQLIRMTS